MFSLNPVSGTPIYRQLVEQVRRMVSSGLLKPGDTLPSVRELATTHAVNPMTISKAYSLLETEGLLVRQRGKPMAVASSVQLRENKSDRLQRLQPVLDNLVMAARQLELDSDEIVRALRTRMEKKNG